jgi:glycosyltransferase involved in cell wall biosynthesis
MKILQVTPYFPPHVGGLEKCVYKISEQLVRKGHKVVVYTANFPKSKPLEIVEGMVVHRLPVFFRVFNAPVVLFLSYMLKERADVVHVHIPPVFGALSSIFFAKINKKPVVLTYHNDTIGHGLIERFVAKLYNTLENNLILKNVAIITVPSQAYKEKLVGRGMEEDRIEVVNNGVDFRVRSKTSEIAHLQKKHKLSGKKIILFIGALETRKGVEYLIKAVPEIAKEISEVKILVVGDGKMKSKLQCLAHDLRVEDSILFTGYLPDEELGVLYDVADVFVLPSLYETFSLVILEAMTHGIPVVTTDIAGTRALVKSGHNGLAIEPRSPKRLASAIVRVLLDDRFAKEIGEKGKQTSIKYSWDRAASEMIQVYQRVSGIVTAN